MHEITVGLEGRAYTVLVGSGLIARAGTLIAPYLRRPRTAVVTDRTVRELHGAALARAMAEQHIEAPQIVLEPGEQTKSFEGLADLSGRLLQLKLDRGDCIVAFGGGVVGDLAGFAAAIYKRGVDFVQVPTISAFICTERATARPRAPLSRAITSPPWASSHSKKPKSPSSPYLITSA